ncbi:Uncharacterized protein HZ326_30957 [Fusarium oxysporum f. sp. albedinis]|nr:Uncharacterized protein HZ326_30957 [Fusarium oxysporum f. sp. albedinis]
MVVGSAALKSNYVMLCYVMYIFRPGGPKLSTIAALLILARIICKASWIGAVSPDLISEVIPANSPPKHHQFILIPSMNSPPILEEIQVINPYDDNSFIREEHSRCLWQGDPTRAVDLPVENDRGTNFKPFHVETRNFRVSPLPPTPLQLFQLFLPIQSRPKSEAALAFYVEFLSTYQVVAGVAFTYGVSNEMPLLTTTQSSRLADANTCDGFCSLADWLESRVLCILGGLSLVNPAR